MSEHWVIVEVDGGMVQDTETSVREQISVIVIDLDNLRWKTQSDEKEAVEYYRAKLEELREFVEPGKARRYWRGVMTGAVGWAR